jgi:uncharacterized membrane protein YcaP (DUF421 family)
MDTVLRAAAIYLFILILFRIAGRRAVAELTTFDFVLLLIIGEATQQALVGEDFSMTTALLVIVSLIGIDITFGWVKDRWPLMEKLVDGVPLLLVENGRPLERRMRKARVSVDDILHTARESQGLERLDQSKFAVLEVSGGITVIPKDKAEQ